MAGDVKIEDQLEMADACLGMIKDKLMDLGIQMDACPPMFYPEAIHNLFVWTAWASRDCEREHHWHNGDAKASAQCIGEGIRKFGREQSARERVRKKQP